MTDRPLKLVFLGLSLSSSWGNGHATTYRALLRALADSGHDVLFLERDTEWYAKHRDVREPDYCDLAFYNSVPELWRFRDVIANASAVVVGSYVPDGIAAIDWVQRTARGVTAFYDIDTPITLAALETDRCAYIASRQVPGFDLYLSFTGGPLLQRIERSFGAKAARALYCSVDPEMYRPVPAPKWWDLGYLGTYSADRQPALERLLLEPARRAPDRRFAVVGAQYPAGIEWPANVDRIEHLAPNRHAEFYASLGWALNITRAEMIRAGFSPSVRLFEAAACGTPIISDDWTGLPTIFEPNKEIVIAESADGTLAAIGYSDELRERIGRSGRERVLREHTSQHRAHDLMRLVGTAIEAKAPSYNTCALVRTPQIRRTGTLPQSPRLSGNEHTFADVAPDKPE